MEDYSPFSGDKVDTGQIIKGFFAIFGNVKFGQSFKVGTPQTATFGSMGNLKAN